jgi:hypothetical protein
LAEDSEPPSLVFLDACCAINVLASGAAEEILRSLPCQVAVTPRVLEEDVLYVRDGPEREPAEDGPELELGLTASDDPAIIIHEVGLQPLVDCGAIGAADPLSDEELETFVTLALELDDGEAETAAAALCRGGAVATDDKKAIRVLGLHAPGLVILRTSALLETWAVSRSVPGARVREVLVAIERKASFLPPRDDPERGWWVRMVEAGA